MLAYLGLGLNQHSIFSVVLLDKAVSSEGISKIQRDCKNLSNLKFPKTVCLGKINSLVE